MQGSTFAHSLGDDAEEATLTAAVRMTAAALQALKKRKLYETQMEGVENNIMRVNEQQMMLENQRTTVETVSALSNAAKASKQTMHEMKVAPRPPAALPGRSVGSAELRVSAHLHFMPLAGVMAELEQGWSGLRMIDDI